MMLIIRCIYNIKANIFIKKSSLLCCILFFLLKKFLELEYLKLIYEQNSVSTPFVNLGCKKPISKPSAPFLAFLSISLTPLPSAC